MVTGYSIQFNEGAVADLKGVRVYDRRRIVDAIAEHLTLRPLHESRRRKALVGLVPPWEQVRPVWQLRVGDYRVFYDVDEAARTVIVQAVRRKRATGTTEDSL